MRSIYIDLDVWENFQFLYPKKASRQIEDLLRMCISYNKTKSGDEVIDEEQSLKDIEEKQLLLEKLRNDAKSNEILIKETAESLSKSVLAIRLKQDEENKKNQEEEIYKKEEFERVMAIDDSMRNAGVYRRIYLNADKKQRVWK
jgi:hypothetical protein